MSQIGPSGTCHSIGVRTLGSTDEIEERASISMTRCQAVGVAVEMARGDNRLRVRGVLIVAQSEEIHTKEYQEKIPTSLPEND